MPGKDDPLATTAEVGRLLGVSPNTVRRYVAEAKIPPPIKLSPKVHRFRLDDRFFEWVAHGGPPPQRPAGNGMDRAIAAARAGITTRKGSWE